MAFINTDFDWSGHESEPEAARTTPLRFVEFDDVSDVVALAHALRVPFLDRIKLGPAGGGNILGCCDTAPDGSSTVTLDTYSVLIALHEFAHAGDNRTEVDSHGRAFKHRMVKFIKKAEKYLESRICEAVIPDDATEEVPTVPAPEPVVEPVEQLDLWKILSEAA